MIIIRLYSTACALAITLLWQSLRLCPHAVVMHVYSCCNVLINYPGSRLNKLETVGMSSGGGGHLAFLVMEDMVLLPPVGQVGCMHMIIVSPFHCFTQQLRDTSIKWGFMMRGISKLPNF